MASAPHTVERAVALLRSLATPISEALSAGARHGILRVPLNHAGYLQPERKRSDLSNVLWVGPSPSEVRDPSTDAGVLHIVASQCDVMRRTATLEASSDIVNHAFRKAGFITETRPLKVCRRPCWQGQAHQGLAALHAYQHKVSQA